VTYALTCHDDSAVLISPWFRQDTHIDPLALTQPSILPPVMLKPTNDVSDDMQTPKQTPHHMLWGSVAVVAHVVVISFPNGSNPIYGVWMADRQCSHIRRCAHPHPGCYGSPSGSRCATVNVNPMVLAETRKYDTFSDI
jgi:hypothetical protein